MGYEMKNIYVLRYSLVCFQQSKLTKITHSVGRRSKEFIQFLSIAQGSTSELETQLIISNNLGFLKKEDLYLLDELDEISRMIIGLIRTLKK